MPRRRKEAENFRNFFLLGAFIDQLDTRWVNFFYLWSLFDYFYFSISTVLSNFWPVWRTWTMNLQICLSIFDPFYTFLLLLWTLWSFFRPFYQQFLTKSWKYFVHFFSFLNNSDYFQSFIEQFQLFFDHYIFTPFFPQSVWMPLATDWYLSWPSIGDDTLDANLTINSVHLQMKTHEFINF